MNEVKEWGYKDEKIDFLEEFFEENNEKKCVSCKQNANFFLSLVRLDPKLIDSYKQFFFDDTTVLNLCADHFVDEIIKEIQSNKVSVDIINVPYTSENGVYIVGVL